MWLDKKTKENILLFLGAILVGVSIYAVSADADSAYNLWFMSLPEGLRRIVATVVILGGIFTVPAWMIAKIVMRVRRYIKDERDDTGENGAADGETEVSPTHSADPNDHSDTSLFRTSPFDERTNVGKSLGLIATFSVVAALMTFGFSQAAIDSGGGAAWSIMIIPLFMWSPLIFAILVKKEITVSGDTVTVRRIRLGGGRKFRFGDIVSIDSRDIHVMWDDGLAADATDVAIEYFTIKTSLGKNINISPTTKGYGALIKSLELAVPHLCYWQTGKRKQHEPVAATQKAATQKAATRKKKSSSASKSVAVSLLVVGIVGVIVTAVIFSIRSSSDSGPRSRRVPSAEQGVVQEEIAQREAVEEYNTEPEPDEESTTEPVADLPLMPWDMSVQITDNIGTQEISRAVIGMRAENIFRLMRFTNKFELVFEFSVWVETTTNGTFHTIMEPGEVYRVTVQGDGKSAQIWVETSDGSTVIFQGDDTEANSEFMRVSPETGERIDASDEPVWNLSGDYYADDLELMRFLAPAYRFRAGLMPLEEKREQWQGLLCNCERYTYRSSGYGVGTGIETPEDADRTFVTESITHYFSEETGQWVGMRLTNSEHIHEPGSDYYTARRHADFKLQTVRYS